MGYSTDFEGQFILSRELTDAEANYINQFADTRRMQRDVSMLQSMFKGEGGLNGDYGVEGEFFIGGTGHAGQDHDESIIDFNTPPSTQPGLWCQWNIENNKFIVWDGGEKFYNYVEWLEYYIEKFFKPWGVVVNGEVEWQGEDREDIGKIIVTNNVVTTQLGEMVIVYK